MEQLAADRVDGVDSEMATIEEAVAALGRGEMIVVVDAPDRENEGDLVMAAEKATPEAISFMAAHGRGLICTPLPAEQLARLGIPPMASANHDRMGTAFHVSVDIRDRATTGISATDRAATIRALSSPTSDHTDFTMPGHVFPLAAREGGVLERPGHTEAAVDLMTIAGLRPAGVICEILSDDGTMERYPGLVDFARLHGLPIIAISDLIAFRLRTESSVNRTEIAPALLAEGEFKAIGYRDKHNGAEHLALVHGDISACTEPLVRVHRECLAGDVFGSVGCDCGEKLRAALEAIATEGCGAVLYLRGRDHDRATTGILRDLDIDRLRLLGDDSRMGVGIEEDFIKVVDRVPLHVQGAAPAWARAV